MPYQKCEESAADLVMNLFISNPQGRHSHHNLLHTIKVVNHAKEIAAFYHLNETDICILLLAAWFHDVGHLFGDTQPGDRSAMIMTSYLKTHDVSSEVLEQACTCMLSTKSGPRLSMLVEKIFCDAVTYDYGTPYFREVALLESDEMEIKKGGTFTDRYNHSLQKLIHHVYYTEYCQLKLNPGKLENIAWLRSHIFP